MKRKCNVPLFLMKQLLIPRGFSSYQGVCVRVRVCYLCVWTVPVIAAQKFMEQESGLLLQEQDIPMQEMHVIVFH